MGKEYEREITVQGSVPNLGPVLLFDDIEDLLKWVEAGTGGDSVFEKIATVAYNGSACLHMKSRTTNAAEDDEISGYRDTIMRPGKRYRMECLFRPDASAQSKLVFFRALLYDGTNSHNAQVRWDEVNTKWQYLNSVAGWTDVPGGSQDLVADQFHRFLLEWDLSSGKYIRFVCDGLEVDLSGVSFYVTADASATIMRLDVGMFAGAAPPGELYFDDVLVLEI